MVTKDSIIFCGETVKDPVDTTISGALGEVKSLGSIGFIGLRRVVVRRMENGCCFVWRYYLSSKKDPKAQSKLVVSSFLLQKARRMHLGNL